MKSIYKLKNNYRLRAAVYSFIFLIFLLQIKINAEEQRDLREGITDYTSDENRWGFLPRFKMNPDTGIGTGIKLKGANVFGTPLYFDITNLITTAHYQIYETTVTAPRLGSGDDYWYASVFAELDLIPEMRFFGIGNNTKNYMDNERDDKTGNESTLSYKNLDTRLLAGRCVGGMFFIAIEPLYREVRTGRSGNENLAQATDVYKNIDGTAGGRSAGLKLSLIMSDRDNQWRPVSGSRIEISADNRGSYFYSDFNYTKVSADVRKYINIFGGYNILALHLKTESIAGDFNDTPWWDMPYIGGRDTLRGYWEGRFRGSGIILANTEYRFHLFDVSFGIFGHHLEYIFDGSLFFDAGRAFTPDDNWNDSPREGWKYSGGFGMKLSTPPALTGRLDIGFSAEMKYAVYFNFGTVF
ncbi:MAG: outer membrane protein assembly factor [Spirochaetes bacterium]|nr:outer membrane protein assembly factor [Spirochaetota bacterium]